MGSNAVVFTDHVALRHLLSEMEAKHRFEMDALFAEI